MIRIEDNFEDVLGKALAGLGLSVATVAERSGIESSQVDALLAGKINDGAIQKVAPVLGLSAQRLLDMAHQRWRPACELPHWVRLFNTPFPVSGYEEMTVNSYLFWDAGEAIAVDTGANIDLLLEELEARNLHLKSLLITHTHRDHIAALSALRTACPEATIYCPEGEPVPGAVSLREGAVLECGALEVEARETSGHSPGAMSYIVTGHNTTVAFVGDAIFCLSMGKAADAYSRALEHVQRKLLSLEETALLCPGHGPVSSVGDEIRRNPFF